MNRKDGSFYILREAWNSFRRKNYEEVCLVLEKLNEPEPLHPYPCFLHAAALLYSGRLGRAGQLLSVLENLWPDYLPGVELRTFLQMKSASSRDEGLEAFMSALKKHPRDRNLLLGAAIVKNTDDFLSMQKTARLQDFVPVKAPDRDVFMKKTVLVSEGRNRLSKPESRHTSAYFKKKFSGLWHKLYAFRYLIMAAVTAAAVLTGIYAAFSHDHKKAGTEKLEAALNEAVIYGPSSGLIRPEAGPEAKVKYSSTEELTEDFSLAKKLIRKGECNRAVLLLNRIRESNGSFSARDRADFLLSFISSMEDRVFEIPDPADLAARGWMYRGWAAMLEGTAENVRSARGNQTFKLRGTIKADVFYDMDRPELKDGDSAAVKGILEDESTEGIWSVKAFDVKKKDGF